MHIGVIVKLKGLDMKRYGLLGALIGFVIAVLGFTQIPAVAQEADSSEQQVNEPPAPEQRARRRGIPERFDPKRPGGPGVTFGATGIQLPEESAWEITVMPYGDGDLAVIKHNRITGQTLILNCSSTCGNNEQWRDYPVDE